MSDLRRPTSSRVVRGDDIQDARPAPLPSLESGSPNSQAKQERREDPTHRYVFEKGLQTGLARGRQEGATAARQRCEDEARATAEAAGGFAAERMARLVESFETEFSAMESDLADKTLDLAIAVAEKVLLREIRDNTHDILPVISECLSMLAKDASEIVIRLNPADLALLQSIEGERFSEFSPRWQADGSIKPGGCHIESAQTVIDASIESRWQRTLSALGTPASPLADADTQ
ncbi:MAG: FliH/SctL family protein [Burkholderiaceae bacterium]